MLFRRGMQARVLVAPKLESQVRAALVAVQHASEALADEIRGRCPVDTGELRDSIRVIPATSVDGVILGGVEIGGGHGRKNLVLWLEYGTKDNAARPFIRPSIDAVDPATRSLVDGLFPMDERAKPR